MTPTLLHFPAMRDPARRLAKALEIPALEIDLHRFPDGESLVRLPQPLTDILILVSSMHPANDRLTELGLACETLAEAGHRVLLVLPYLCYMRQDKAFRSGEAVSQRIVGRWIARWGEALVTVDPHLHRTRRLTDAVPVARARVVSAAPLLGRHAAERWPEAVLLGPDEESAQWVRQAAAAGSLEWMVARKQRMGDREVHIRLPDRPELRNRTVVLIDDMSVTGRTLAEAARLARERGAREVHALVTHALFAEDAIEAMREAGVDEIASSDSLPHPTNRIRLDGVLARAVRELLAAEPPSPGDSP